LQDYPDVLDDFIDQSQWNDFDLLVACNGRWVKLQDWDGFLTLDGLLCRRE
jgi:hypothetical protein